MSIRGANRAGDSDAQGNDRRRLNGRLDEEPGRFLDRRLYVSSDGNRWFVEFDDDDVVEPGPEDTNTGRLEKPPHTIFLKPDARVFEGRFSTADNFLEHGVVRRIRDDGADDTDIFGDNYDDWFIDAPSRGIGCETLNRGQ